MYKNLLDVLDAIIVFHEKLGKEALAQKDATESEKHYFIQGLKVAKHMIEDEQDVVLDLIPHETLEDIIKALSNVLDREDIEEILDEVYGDEYDDE